MHQICTSLLLIVVKKFQSCLKDCRGGSTWTTEGLAAWSRFCDSHFMGWKVNSGLTPQAFLSGFYLHSHWVRGKILYCRFRGKGVRFISKVAWQKFESAKSWVLRLEWVHGWVTAWVGRWGSEWVKHTVNWKVGGVNNLGNSPTQYDRKQTVLSRRSIFNTTAGCTDKSRFPPACVYSYARARCERNGSASSRSTADWLSISRNKQR